MGFYTTEIRTGKQRLGFEIITLSGKKAVLAHVALNSRYRVGKYSVRPENLGEALKEITEALRQNKQRCLLIDEIGKMELFSPKFRETIILALNSPLPVIATISAKPHPFCDPLKKRADVQLIEVTKGNREQLPRKLYHIALQLLTSKKNAP